MEKKKPYFPASYVLADVSAIQALAAGVANEGQQKRAIKWIIEEACSTYGLGFFPNEASCNDFASGKRFVGQQIVKMLRINTQNMKEKANG